MLRSLLFCLTLLAAGGLAHAEDTTELPPYLRSWLLLGPIENPVGASPDERVRKAHGQDFLGGEATAAPKAGDEAAGQKWVRHDSLSDVLDLAQHFGPTEQATAYFYTTFNSETSGPHYLALGADDTDKVWLNGKVVHDYVTRRSAMPDDLVIPIQLKKGENRLLIKVVNNALGWGMVARIFNEEQFRTFVHDQIALAPLQTSRVFAGETLPAFQLDVPGWLTTAFGGTPAIQTEFYDAGFNRVEQAKANGRYGAVVRVIPAPGSTIGERVEFVTLYRGEKWVNWRGWLRSNETDGASITLPDELGISAKAAKENPGAVAQLVKTGLADAIQTSPAAAVILAGLSDPSGAKADFAERDREWWRQLRRKQELSELVHAVTLPPGYQDQPDKKFPLLLFLHGGGQRTTSSGETVKNCPTALREAAPKKGFILVTPASYPGERWQPESLSTLLDEIEKTYRVDPDRIYVTGLSMGGMGTWNLAQHSPERFAAIAPVCGRTDESQAGKLTQLPTWIFHGDIDRSVVLENSTKMHQAINSQGGKAKLTIYPQTGHAGAWHQAYSDPRLYEWLLANRRGAPVWPPADE